MEKSYIIGQVSIANDPTAVKFTAQSLTSEQQVQAQTNIGLNGIQLVKTNTLEYTLYVGGQSAGVINIPQDQFLESVAFDPETGILTFVFNTSEGQTTTNIDISSLIDTYTAGNGLQVSNNQFSVKLDGSQDNSLTVSANGLMLDKTQFASTAEFQNLSAQVTDNTAQIETLNSNYVKSPVETGAFINGQNTLANVQSSFLVESNNRFDYDNVRAILTHGTFSKIENGYTATGKWGDLAPGPFYSNGWLDLKIQVYQGDIISFDYKITALNSSQTENTLVLGYGGGSKPTVIKSNCAVGDTGRAVKIAPVNDASFYVALSSMTVEITNICISKVTDTYTPFLTDGTAVNVKVYNSDDTENIEITTAVGQSINITQYDNITNLSVLTEGGSLSGQFILSTQYELNDKLTPLFGTFASRPTTTQPYAILYIATDQTGENKVTILPANTDGSVSGNWISI